MLRIAAFVFAFVFPAAMLADDADLRSLETADTGRGWEGVGRLDIAGKGFCTGALIAIDEVLTAAHCFYSKSGELIDRSRVQFLAGLRGGQAQAYRGVRRVVIHPSYVHGGEDVGPPQMMHDLALVQLDRPIQTSRILPFETDAKPIKGDAVGVVSYAKGREDTPSLQESCEVLGLRSGILVMTCAVDYGASGSPVFVFRDGVARIVSVVSSMAELDAQRVSLATALSRPYAELRAAFDDGDLSVTINDQTFIEPGTRQDTGAKFVRP
ncbi:trypsin-like serine peptidase [Aestuariibius sp. 2305UL40-4]|uniref:trypsin-like serine peptidase n=1 Tax=Aestuariibius violaceus TaxID=3234132 RepID=UPI0034879A13